MGYAERMVTLCEHAEKDAFASSHVLESLVSSSCRDCQYQNMDFRALHYAVFTDGLFCINALLVLLM